MGRVRKVLYALAIVDALAGLGIFMLLDGDRQVLAWWLLLNLVAIVLALAARAALSRRRKARRAGTGRQAKSYALRLTTQNGEVVKSGGEKMIADYLYGRNIRYEYEKPAVSSTERRISRPDFYLPDYDTYVEYWGMVNAQDDDTRQEYVKGMEWKLAEYRKNGIKVVSVYPEDLDDLDLVFKKLKSAGR
jgi:hypothetical protein